MPDRPIPFSGPMVRAILDGSKTQTRRVLTPQPYYDGEAWAWVSKNRKRGKRRAFVEALAYSLVEWCPYGVLGDRLWVKETWFSNGADDNVKYAADHADPGVFRINGRSPWRGGVIMPRKLSRITLELTGVRVERLQDISGADAKAEGVAPCGTPGHDDCFYGVSGQEYQCSYQTLWDSLNADRGYGWDVNPWVWALTFRRIEGATHG